MKKCGYDWMQITHDLIAAGYTNQSLSRLVGVEPQLFTMIRSGVRGHNPTFEVGSQLVDLWLRSHIPVTHVRAKATKVRLNGVQAINDKTIKPNQQRMLFAE